MKNLEKFPSTKEALDTYNNIVFKTQPFDKWLECEFVEPPKPTLLDAAINSMKKDLNRLSEEYQTTDRKHRPNYGNPDGFEPCPFCGACPHIRVEDDEGNCHDYDPDYEKNPWSGLYYVIEHTRDYGRSTNALKNTSDIPATKDCLIATEGFEWYGFNDVPHVGGDNAVFETRKAAVEWWNTMIAKAKKNLGAK